MKKNILITILVIIVFCLGGYLVYDKLSLNSNDNNNNNDIIQNEDKVQSEEKNDVYGYAIMEWLPGDGTSNEYYRIVELHKNSNDKTLASYDVTHKNSINKVNSIENLKIVKDKLYYKINYNADMNGISTYSSIMYIDLNDSNKQVNELISWKPENLDDSRKIQTFEASEDYIYFCTINETLEGISYYRFDINNKKIETSTKDEFYSVEENNNPLEDKIYIDGKEVVINENATELIYDGKVVYISQNMIRLYYSFNNEIIFEEMSDCHSFGCDTIKFYKYEPVTETITEMNRQSDPIYFIKAIYN
ncbi:MAG: hypothetical protein IJY25_05825 [Bacilli bacterium]|nr:hypothetical protein [Bacilli bacterium]